MSDTSNIVEPLRPLAIEIGKLTVDPVNARRHPEKNREAIRSSLSRFGQRKPIVVRKDTMTVEAGNGTLEAARELGWTHIAAVVLNDNAIEATGFTIADNRTGELAEWDYTVLTQQLTALIDEDGSLAQSLGFDADELEALSLSAEWGSFGDEDVLTDELSSLESGSGSGSRVITIEVVDTSTYDEILSLVDDLCTNSNGAAKLAR